ncbi:EEF1A lysine methyltransferase 2-like [Liolophura sinensis]|uniref:EEF1A lysine methyltransferase 2-like n=1 Tax=Liolophura sinensis TaxID=3198878 RepID=UPI003159079D
MITMKEDEPDFNSSELGTKDYWDNTYQKEILNFSESGDVGHIWYGEGCHKRVINWMKKSALLHEDPVLDIGCGNGMMLVELRKQGYRNLWGVDYSVGAITLAKQIATSRGMDGIYFQTVDLLSDAVCEGTCLTPGKYKLCLDKGTYDTISSMPEQRELAMRKYRETVREILRVDGQLVITSSNWTRKQLMSQFTPDFYLADEIPTPTLQFGGVCGNTVTVLVFRKVNTNT